MPHPVNSLTTHRPQYTTPDTITPNCVLRAARSKDWLLVITYLKGPSTLKTDPLQKTIQAAFDPEHWIEALRASLQLSNLNVNKEMFVQFFYDRVLSDPDILNGMRWDSLYYTMLDVINASPKNLNDMMAGLKTSDRFADIPEHFRKHLDSA